MTLKHIFLVAVLLTVSSYAYAAKPPKEQMINTGPVFGGTTLKCFVSNTTMNTIDVRIQQWSVDPDDGVTYGNGIDVQLEAKEIDYLVINTFDHDGVQCEMTWWGEAGDLRGTGAVYEGQQLIMTSDAD